MKYNAFDPRALTLLHALLDKAPRLLKENPALITDLEDCGNAVTFARKQIDRIIKYDNI